MSNEPNLSASAADGMILVCSDIQILHQEIAKTNPIGARTVLSILAKATELEQEISQLYALTKES